MNFAKTAVIKFMKRHTNTLSCEIDSVLNTFTSAYLDTVRYKNQIQMLKQLPQYSWTIRAQDNAKQDEIVCLHACVARISQKPRLSPEMLFNTEFHSDFGVCVCVCICVFSPCFYYQQRRQHHQQYHCSHWCSLVFSFFIVFLCFSVCAVIRANFCHC